VQVQDDCQIQPALAGPDVADIARPFLVGPIRREVTIQKVWRDVERVIAVRGRLELARSFNGDPVFAHQATDAPVSDIDTDLLQFFGHSWAAIAAQAQTRLFFDVRQNDQVSALPPAGRSTAESP
jgi:hypothetical protein